MSYHIGQIRRFEGPIFQDLGGFYIIREKGRGQWEVRESTCEETIFFADIYSSQEPIVSTIFCLEHHGT